MLYYVHNPRNVVSVIILPRPHRLREWETLATETFFLFCHRHVNRQWCSRNTQTHRHFKCARVHRFLKVPICSEKTCYYFMCVLPTTRHSQNEVELRQILLSWYMIRPSHRRSHGKARGRNVRSKSKCSVCPAIHTKSRSWLRSSSTREPSDPPLRVVSSFGFFNRYENHNSKVRY